MKAESDVILAPLVFHDDEIDALGAALFYDFGFECLVKVSIIHIK